MYIFVEHNKNNHDNIFIFYQTQLKSWIVGNVTKCSRSLFIFEEADKLPVGLLDVLKPFMDYTEDLGGVDYRNVIFIFLR